MNIECIGNTPDWESRIISNATLAQFTFYLCCDTNWKYHAYR